MRRVLPVVAAGAACAVAWALWPSPAPELDSRTVGRAPPAYAVVYQPPSLSEIQDLVDPEIPVTTSPAATWDRLRWARVEVPVQAQPVATADTTGPVSWTQQGIVDEVPVPAPQTGPLSDVEAADPHKVYDGGEGALDPQLAEADDPHKVYDGHEVHADDPFKVFDDPLTLDPVSTTATGETGASDSARENHVAGRRLDPQAPSASAAETHVDGRKPTPGLSPTEAGTWQPPDLTNTVLAEAPKPDPVEQALLAETLSEPVPVPQWDGPGTDTRQR